jgi:peptidoglycan/LPS O-acetylase OafA/YrhL
MAATNNQKIPILDAFRFIAAVLVVLVHYELVFGEFVIYGAFATTAVSWFFVVSGFILSYTYPKLTSVAELRRFYLHRVIRIYPVYALAVVTSVVFVLWGYGNLGEAFFAEVNRPEPLIHDLPETKGVRFWIGASWRHLVFAQSLNPIETLKFLFNGPLWSLVLEVYFYLVFPLLLLLIKPLNSLARVVAALVVGYILQFLLIQMFLPEAEVLDITNLNVPVYTNPLIRGFEFLFGMLIYKAFLLTRTDNETLSLRLAPSLVTIVAYVAVIHYASVYTPYQYHAFFIELPFVTAMVYALLKMNWYPSQGTVRFCTVLGGMSYVLYCFHWPVMEFIQYTDLLVPSLPFPVHITMLLIGLLLLSYLLFRFVESPLRKILYRLIDKPAV